jgi:hypothetical protein
MPYLRSPSLVLAKVVRGCVLTALATPALCEPIPLGPEVSIDPEPGIYFRCPTIAGRDDGSFAIAWPRVHVNADTEVVIRTVDAAGALAPARVPVFEPRNIVELIRLGATPSGYTLLWQGGRFPFPFLSLELDATGLTTGEAIEFAREGVQVFPRTGGGFVTTWVDARQSVNVQFLDSAGNPLGPITRVAARPAWTGVAQRSDGEVLVYWPQLPARSGTSAGLVARRFDSFGRPQGKLLSLTPPAPKHTLGLFQVAWGDDGTIAVAWMSEPAFGRSVPGRLLMRTLDENGKALQPTLTLATTEPRQSAKIVPSALAVDDEGNALFLWVDFEGVPPSTQALILERGSSLPEPLDFTSPASETFTAITCASAAVAGDSWVIAWKADDRASLPRQLTELLFLREFAR